MAKSYAEMADDILNGALTNPAKNPYDPATGHQASMPAMDPNDKLVEMNDSQRSILMEQAGVPATTPQAPVEDPTPQDWEAPTITMEITPEDLETLSEAKRIITKIQEATTVGNLGVNMAGPSGDAKSVKLPNPRKATPKKRAKLKKANPYNESTDFLSYLKA